jgi:short-subunit dehydrogenase
MTALVTGATAGIGFEFADELASRGIDLVLVARDKSRLDTISREFTDRYKITVETLPADLAIREQLDLVANRASQQDIKLVVNNAGFGLNESFFEDDVELEQYLLDVLVTAVMRITHAAMPGMIARDLGGVINVSSIAGWMTSGTYSATKSWVTTFSESLAMQLRDSKVNVMAVCPGYTRTEFQDRAGMGTESIPDWMWLHAHQVVLDALKDFEKGKCISVPGMQYKVLSLVAQYLPRPIVRKLSVASRR